MRLLVHVFRLQLVVLQFGHLVYTEGYLQDLLTFVEHPSVVQTKILALSQPCPVNNGIINFAQIPKWKKQQCRVE